METVSVRKAFRMIFWDVLQEEALLDLLIDDLIITVYSSSKQPDLLPRVSFEPTGNDQEDLENRYFGRSTSQIYVLCLISKNSQKLIWSKCIQNEIYCD